MITRQFKSSRGLSLVETMIAIVILSAAVIGASGYRYYAALDARKADIQMTAARIGLLFCESWHGVNGIETYDPTASSSSDLQITPITVPASYKYAGFTTLGGYMVVASDANNVNYYAVLSWKDVAAGLRALNVTVAWPQRGQSAAVITDTDKLFMLTTYTLK